MYCPRVTKLCLQLMNSGYACGKENCSADPYSLNLVGQVNTCLHPNCLKAPFEYMNRIMIYCEMPHCLSLGFLERQLSQGGHFVSYCVPLYIWTQCLLPVQANVNLSLRKHSIFGEKKKIVHREQGMAKQQTPVDSHNLHQLFNVGRMPQDLTADFLQST